MKKLKLSIEKVPYNIQKFGNLSGVSFVMLMDTRNFRSIVLKIIDIAMLTIWIRADLGNNGIENETNDYIICQ